MQRVQEILQSAHYFDLTLMLIDIERDIKAFKAGLLNHPEILAKTRQLIKSEIERRALLIPTEKLIYDLDIPNLKVLK
jgi:hypothetical protein